MSEAVLEVKGLSTFRNCLMVLNDAVAWELDGTRDPCTCTCIDLDPCELYDHCPAVEDSLREAI